jgi:hypothetical protein
MSESDTSAEPLKEEVPVDLSGGIKTVGNVTAPGGSGSEGGGDLLTPAPQRTVIVKWSGREYEVEMGGLKTIGDLKVRIMEKTKVKVDRQKLLNVMYKGM